MAQSTLPIHYHISDYEQWEGDWELIDGIPVAMSPAPVLQHQRLVMLLTMALEESLTDCEACRVYPEAEWRVTDDTVFRPDGVVICYPPSRYLDRPPALILEVLSPASARLDREYKPVRYAREGVRHYLLTDPDRKQVTVFRLAGDHFEAVAETGQDTLDFDLGPCTARIDFARVFARL